jgi:hypothetical protein
MRRALAIALAAALAGCSQGADAPAGGAGPSYDAGAYDGPFEVPSGPALTVPLTGCGGPGYAAPFSVGGQTFQLTIDTGSGTLAVASSNCTNCGVAPAYAPGPSAMDQDKKASDAYVLGSWQGEVYSDSVALGATTAQATMAIAAIDTQTAFFNHSGCGLGTVPFAPQGIVGFGPPALAASGTDAFVTKATQAAGIPDVFAIELCPQGGQLMLGGVDPVAGALSGPAQYTPLIGGSYYQVALDDLQLGGTSLGYGASDFGAAAVDTGTSVLSLPGPIFQALAAAVEGTPAFSAAFSGMTGWLGTTTCLTSSLDTGTLDAQLPTLTLVLPMTGGGTTPIVLPATKSYLTPAASNGTTFYCSGILQNPLATGTVIGTSVMIGQMVVFDVDGARIGFVPQAMCP